jgi:hypothetical protein
MHWWQPFARSTGIRYGSTDGIKNTNIGYLIADKYKNNLLSVHFFAYLNTIFAIVALNDVFHFKNELRL